MNQNVTASFGLSVLIVVFFAVVLYQPDPPPPVPKPESRASVSVRSESPPAAEPVAAPPAPIVRATTPPAEAVPLPAVPVAPVAVRPRERVATEVPVARRPSAPGSGAAVASAPRSGDATVTRVAARRPAPVVVEREPRGAFTQARAGESLTDVANRVYGSADAAQTLWMANRDILDRADATLRPGTLLRTP